MKVAIIGAGISGLSCAFELEKHGITPVIFEKKGQIGESTNISGLWLRLFMRCGGDPGKFLKKKYALDIKPTSKLNEVTMISPGKRTSVRGNLGCLYKRGVENHSLENQIASKINANIIFDSFVEIEDIKDDFSDIVVATATPIISKKMNVWTDTFVSQARIAMITGEFKVDTAYIWFNEKFASKAFCYLIPNNPKEATLAMLINNYSSNEIDYYWDKFTTYENINYNIIQTSDIEHVCGFVNPFRVGNVYFVGNAAGVTDDLIGIGAFNAIESGIFAARSIALGADYNKLMQPIFTHITKLHELREAVNDLENRDFDKMVGFAGLPIIRQSIYNNPLMKLHYLAPVVKLFNKKKVKK